MELWRKLTNVSLETVNLNKDFIFCFRFINCQGKGSLVCDWTFSGASLLCVRACGEAVTLTFLMLHEWIPCLWASRRGACGSHSLLLGVYSEFLSLFSEHEFLPVGGGRMLGKLWWKTSQVPQVQKYVFILLVFVLAAKNNLPEPHQFCWEELEGLDHLDVILPFFHTQMSYNVQDIEKHLMCSRNGCHE